MSHHKPNDLLSYNNRSWKIVKFLGQGTFGSVYSVENEKKQLQAVKIMAKERSESAVYRELSNLSLVRDKGRASGNSTFVVQFHCWFATFDNIYMVLELVGCDLKQVMKQPRNRFGLPYPVIKDYRICLLKGLQFLGECGLIHMDIKPENIAMGYGSTKMVKILDLGLALKVDEEKAVCGTPIYMAPEVFGEIAVLQSSDMWSLGLTLAELATGKSVAGSASDYPDILELYACFIGVPPIKYTSYISVPSVKRRAQQLSHTTDIGEGSISHIVSNVNFRHLVKAMLEWFPDKRTTPQEAIEKSNFLV